MKELLVATRNKGKVREIKEILKDFDFEITSLLDYPDMPTIDEDGATFAENAAKKAQVIAAHTGRLVMGEDSGLEVARIKNAPGIYSARFAGEDATDEENNAKLLCALHRVPMSKRQCRYRWFIALADAGTLIGVVEGSCSGRVALAPQGVNGFGYDPLFYLPRYKMTFGQLDPTIKSRISHRAKALQKFRVMFAAHLKKSKTTF